MTLPQRYAGVMSGTSLDGVDAVIADFAPADGRVCATLGAAHLDFPPALHDELHALQQAGSDELRRAARASNQLADLYSEAIAAACVDAGMVPRDLVAAGVHGQTVRHRPDEGWTLQLNNAARVAENAGVTVVADFRSRDVAAGGHGAPLVPAFHHALFGRAGVHRVVVNLGGIANITDLPLHGPVRGFDTGPGNVLLDLWHARHRGGRYDDEGAWAAGGSPDAQLLARLLQEPYFTAPPPKSTGRDLFNARWLDTALAGIAVDPGTPAERSLATGSLRAVAARDIQATLLALTVRTLGDAIRRHAPGATEIMVAGGGAHNRALLAALTRDLDTRRVLTTDSEGVAVEHVEALAFAWLAKAALEGAPGNLPAVTGARGPRVLGAIYRR
jgi:anhydro-N-acetylmuramic acid kinase